MDSPFYYVQLALSILKREQLIRRGGLRNKTNFLLISESLWCSSMLDWTQLFELINSFLFKLSHKKVSKFSKEKPFLMSRRNAWICPIYFHSEKHSA